jgi:peroxiredoxin
MSKKRDTRQFIISILIPILALLQFCLYGCSAFVEDSVKVTRVSTVSSEKFDIIKYRGKRLVLFLYSIDDPRVDKAAKLMNDLYRIRREYNFDVVGVSLNPDRAPEVQHYNQANGISFPVFLDHNKELFLKLKMRGNIGFYIFDKQGKKLVRQLGIYTPGSVDLEHYWRASASRYLKIGYIPEDEPILGIKPPLPLFEAKALDGRAINIKEIYKTSPAVIVIFSPTCGSCKKELDFLNSIYNAGELKGNFEIVAISIGKKDITEKLFKKKKFLFPVIIDTGERVTSIFPSYIGQIPLSFVVDTQGRINALHAGFNAYLRDIYVMELKKLAGLLNPPLLLKNWYSGEQRCRICHEKEHIQWSLTTHSNAFLSLVRKGKEEDENCIPCHVMGFGSKGGYDIKNKKFSKYFEGVQCESCHGPGSKSCSAFNRGGSIKRKGSDWKKLCLSCHTKKESLNFVFDRRFPKVLHSMGPDLSAMDREDRLKVMRKFREKQNLFDNPAKYVGAKACRECHEREYDHWKKTRHASAHKTDKAKAARPEEMLRYYTGVGSRGGYPEPGRKGVQCEACHGPGERHIEKPEEKGHDYIVGLGGDDCASCVVEQICRRCHSPVYDQDFDFDKQIKKIRHKISLNSEDIR